MLPVKHSSHLLRCTHRSFQHLQILHVRFPLVTVPTLASPTKSSIKFSTANISTPRIQQVARHLSTSAPQRIEMAQLPISEKGYHPKAPAAYSVRKIAPANTLEHRIFIEKDGVPVSPFHDIPLYANEQQTVLNMIVEIPRWTNGKLEVGSHISRSHWPRETAPYSCCALCVRDIIAN